MNQNSIGIIVLAAGASSRMGEPKQLLRLAGETLLRRSVNAALDTACHPVIVVLGASAERMRAEVSDSQAQVVVNDSWPEGMSSSLRCGLSALETAGTTEAAIVMLCDQPFVTAGVINELIEKYLATRSSIVATRYAAADATEDAAVSSHTLGVPALFSRALFPELRQLRGDRGAKRLIMRDPRRLSTINAPAAAFDIDRPADYRKLPG